MTYILMSYRTANLQMLHFTYYSTNICTEYFKHAAHSPFFFSSKCRLFHNATFFGSCVIHISYTGVLKFKKKKSGAKGLSINSPQFNFLSLYVIINGLYSTSDRQYSDVLVVQQSSITISVLVNSTQYSHLECPFFPEVTCYCIYE